MTSVLLTLLILSSPLGLARLAGAAEAAPGGVVIMASGPWPPYAGEDLPGYGASVEVARAAFAAVGLKLEVRFFPWKRAVHEAGRNPDIAGYLPEYYSDHISQQCLFSDPMGWSHLRFIYPVAGGFDWHSLDDLKGKRIGVVSGYLNTDDFDAKVADGTITTHEVVDDATLVRMVAEGRLEAAVIDPNVYQYILAQRESRVRRGQVSLHPKPLGENTLHLCFKPDERGEELRRLFNKGLSQLDIRAIQEEYLQSYGSQWPRPLH